MFTEDLCDGELQVLAAVTPADAVDYLELRQAEDYGSEGMPQWSDVYVVDRHGQRCAGATDLAACEQAFAELPLGSDFVTPHYFGPGPSYTSLAFTRAASVGVVADLAALREFVGPVDSPGDAALTGHLLGHRLVCEPGPDVGQRGDDYVLFTRSGSGCGEGDDIRHHVVLVRSDGSVEILQSELVEAGDPGCAVGRLPAGLCRPAVHRRGRGVGEFFAEVAHLEAAAVVAFDQLARELVLHGAPSQLVRAAVRARHDEVRHARLTARLARRFGVRPVRPRVAVQPPRSLVAIAIDNAAEGCVRETFGAAVAQIQAFQASDPTVRAVLGPIARDETRHAALSWELRAWADGRLGRADRRRVAGSTEAALSRIEAELTRPLRDDVHRVAGLPRPEQGRRLVRAMGDALYRRKSAVLAPA